MNKGLLGALVVAMAVSFLFSLMILRSVFRREDPMSLVSASVLTVVYPYAVVLLYAIIYAALPRASSITGRCDGIC